jgi:hypothetical protein
MKVWSDKTIDLRIFTQGKACYQAKDKAYVRVLDEGEEFSQGLSHDEQVVHLITYEAENENLESQALTFS